MLSSSKVVGSLVKESLITTLFNNRCSSYRCRYSEETMPFIDGHQRNKRAKGRQPCWVFFLQVEKAGESF